MGLQLGQNSNQTGGLQLGGNQPQSGGLQLGREPQVPTSAPLQGGGLNLVKGAKLDLTKGNPGLDQLLIGLGWDVNTGGGASFDLDVEVFLLGGNGQVLSPSHVVFYNNSISPDGAVKHNGDNRTGVGDGDDETVSMKLSQISPDVQRAVFTVTIDQALVKNQNFGQVSNAYIRVEDESTGQEICRYDLTEDYSTSISLIVGEVYRHQNEWKFGALGNGSSLDLAGLCQQYGAM